MNAVSAVAAGSLVVGSHLLARVTGAWPSVLTVAALVGVASSLATRRPALTG